MLALSSSRALHTQLQPSENTKGRPMIATDIFMSDCACRRPIKQPRSPGSSQSHLRQRKGPAAAHHRHGSIKQSFRHSHRQRSLPCRAFPGGGAFSLDSLAGSRKLSIYNAGQRNRKAKSVRQRHICRAREMTSQEACTLLGLQGSHSKEELRAAYLERIKEVGKGSMHRVCMLLL